MAVATATATRIGDRELRAALAQIGPILRIAPKGYKIIGIKASDGVATFTANWDGIWAEASVPAEGPLADVFLDVAHFAPFARHANGPVTIEDDVTDSDIPKINLRTGRRRVTLRRAIGTDFCPVPKGDWVEGTAWDLDHDDVTNLKGIARFASTDDNRPIITTVNLNAEHAAATDSYRLGLCEMVFEGLDEDGILVPAQVFKMMPNPVLDSAFVLEHGTVDNRDAVRWSDGQLTVTCRTVEGKFPNYKGLMPGHWVTKVTVNRAAFIETVAALHPYCIDATPLRIHFARDQLTFFSVMPDGISEAEEILPATCVTSGGQALPDKPVAFNSGYLLEVSKTGRDPDLVFDMVDQLKPSRFYGGPEKDVLTLLMPVRVA